MNNRIRGLSPEDQVRELLVTVRELQLENQKLRDRVDQQSWEIEHHRNSYKVDSWGQTI